MASEIADDGMSNGRLARLSPALLHMGFWVLAGFAFLFANSLEFPQDIARANAFWLGITGMILSAFLLPMANGLGGLSWPNVLRLVPVLLLLAAAFTAAGNFLSFLALEMDYQSFLWVYYFQGVIRNGFVLLLWAVLALGFVGHQAPAKSSEPVRPTPSSSNGDQMFAVERNGSVHLAALAEIMFFKAAEDYVEVVTGDAIFLKRSTLKSLEEELAAKGFVRVHRSILVNMPHIANYTPKRNGDFVVELKGGQRLPGSRRFKQAFAERISGL